jgi:hypothetical protein
VTVAESVLLSPKGMLELAGAVVVEDPVGVASKHSSVVPSELPE